MASPVSTAVKYFPYNIPGAPQFTGTAGSGTSAMRALLVSGFGLRSVTSAVVLDGFVRLTLAAEPLQPNMLYSVINVSGATPADANGHQRVMFASTTELRYPTDLPDGAITGSITIMTPGAGWQELFIGTATNKAAFKRTDPAATPHALLVDDTTGVCMGMTGVLSASSASDGTQKFPFETGKSYWMKSKSADTTPVVYDVFVDSASLYFLPCPSSSVSGYSNNRTVIAHFFGDPILGRLTDDVGCLLTGRPTNLTPDEPLNGSVLNYADTAGLTCWAKSWTKIGSSRKAWFSADGSKGDNRSGNDVTQGSYPNPYDGVMRITGVIACEGANWEDTLVVRRGLMPGLRHILHNRVSAFITPRGDLVPTQDGDRLYPFSSANAMNVDATPDGIALMSFLNGWR